jgi:hypothetical protein
MLLNQHAVIFQRMKLINKVFPLFFEYSCSSHRMSSALYSSCSSTFSPVQLSSRHLMHAFVYGSPAFHCNSFKPSTTYLCLRLDGLDCCTAVHWTVLLQPRTSTWSCSKKKQNTKLPPINAVTRATERQHAVGLVISSQTWRSPSNSNVNNVKYCILW